MTNNDQKKKKGKIAAISVVSILVASAIVTGIVVPLAQGQKRDQKGGIKNQGDAKKPNEDQKPQVEDPNKGKKEPHQKDVPNGITFKPSVILHSARYNKLTFDIANLNADKLKDQDVTVNLLDAATNKIKETKTFTIKKNNQQIIFTNLDENKNYTIDIIFNGNSVMKQDFVTEKKPKDFASVLSATNASIGLTSLSQFNDDLNNVEILIKNLSDSKSAPISLKASELPLNKGNIRITLQDLNFTLEPGTKYSADIFLTEDNQKTEVASTINFETPDVKNVVYSYLSDEGVNKIILYGLKENGKHIELEYKHLGTSLNYQKITSTNLITNGKVEITFNSDLGFDNAYEFKVKYANETNYLRFDGSNSDVGTFKTLAAPRITVDTNNGSSIKLSQIGKNVNKDNLYLRYRDKASGGAWTEKKLKEIEGFENGSLNLNQYLSLNKDYEAQLLYKKQNKNETESTILSQVEFRIKQTLSFDILKSTTTSTKAILTFKDEDEKEETPNHKYQNVVLKYAKLGNLNLITANLNNKVIGSLSYAQSIIENLEQNTIYNWVLESINGEKIDGGTFKTGKASSNLKPETDKNQFETNLSNLVAVENRLLDGVQVVVKNTFGYLEGNGNFQYQPRQIKIKYYPENSEKDYLTETINVTKEDIINKKLFTKQIENLENANYIFEVSYVNGLDENYNDAVFVSKFKINYNLPEVEFKNDEGTLIVKHLSSLNGKKITVKYSDGQGEVKSVSNEVKNGQFDGKLENLRPETHFQLKIEIDSDDIEFMSTIIGESRKSFFGDAGNNENLVIESSIMTHAQKNIIWIVHEQKDVISGTVNIFPILEGFTSFASKKVQIRIGTNEELDKVTNEDYNSDQVHTVQTDTFDNTGKPSNGGKWVNGLKPNTDYKIRVYEVGADKSLKKIAERPYHTPNITPPRVQRLEVIDSNTDHFGFKVENLQEIRDILGNDANIIFRAQKITDTNSYQNFDTFAEHSFNTGDAQSFKTLKWTKSKGLLGNQGHIVRVRPFTGASTENYKKWFEDKQKYQIILTVVKNNKEYVIATNLANDLLVPNQTPPRLIDADTVNVLKDKSTTNDSYTSSVGFKLQNLEAYKAKDGEESKLKAYYIESDNFLSKGDPKQWKVLGDVKVKDDNTADVTFDNLTPGTKYDFVIVDNNGTKIISRVNVQTSSIPKLRTKTRGDTIMRFNLAELAGSQGVLKQGTYKIKYSKDNSYNQESEPVVIDQNINLSNFQGTLLFTLKNGLEPNTTYKFKLVDENDKVILGYEDFFKTNKSQSEETIIGNDFAIVKLINPSYQLREGSYSIAKRGKDTETDKTVLDILRMQYSTKADFSDYKEYSVALSENETQLINLRFDHLTPNTTYYYRLVKGTVKAKIIQKNGTDNSAPVVELNTDAPLLKGQFTTFNVKQYIQADKNKATITFSNISGITDKDQVYLNYKKQDQTNIYDVAFDYQIIDGKIVFTLDRLNENTIYEYQLISNIGDRHLINGSFSTSHTTTEVQAREFSIDEAYRRIRLTNFDDYIGRNIKITLFSSDEKKNNRKQVSSIVTTLTSDNGEFLWDFDELDDITNYEYMFELLDSENKVEKTLAHGEFFVSAKFTGGGDKTVTTNVKALGNYEINTWYPVTTLQEIYANQKNWAEQVEKSLEEIGIYGSSVAVGNVAYGWHKLIVQGSQHKYSKKEENKLVYYYLFADKENLDDDPNHPNNQGVEKGIKFEFKLVGNTIQVRILEVKRKSAVIDRRADISSFKWEDLDTDLVYKSSLGLINQYTRETVTDFINVSGFKFKATTLKRGARDFSVPHILRYSVNEGAPALNDKTVSNNTDHKKHTNVAFIHLNNPKQEDAYGDFNDSNEFNYDVLYNQYVAKDNKLLPFNGNFTISPSFFPTLPISGKNIAETGFKFDGSIRRKFFDTLSASGRIRFTGQDVVNKNWIALNSHDVIMFEDEIDAYSDKYFKEFDLAKRLIWRDGNTLKGMRLTLNDSQYGWGASLGMLDDTVYYLDLDGSLDLSNLSWDEFTRLAKKHTTFKYMNPDSPGTAIGGISFISRSKEFIANPTDPYINHQNLSSVVELDANSIEGQESRKLKLFNAELGEYTIKIEYPIFFPTLEKTTYSPVTKTINITEANKKFFEVDLTEDLKYSTEYKVTLIKPNKEEQVISGYNTNIPGGITRFVKRDIKKGTIGVNNKGLYDYAPNPERRFRIPYSDVDFKFTDEDQISLTNRIGAFLIGSPKLGNGQMKYKWSFKTQVPSNNSGNNNRWDKNPLSRIESILTAAVSDDNSKIVIFWIQIRAINNIIAFVVQGAKEYTLNEQDKNDIQKIDLQKVFASNKLSKSIKNDVFSSDNVTEDDFKGDANKNRVSVFGVYIKDKEKMEEVNPSNK
ncbi:hypothetical protein [Ureaplasma canigenitalium]|uniref:hypothetical protein n=1 Tax=Ureaplasma canigenitalium TaxID=42092 RepID=UPI0004E210A9|nr:hypothetical protein [Ureaplasma canigenitalium]